MKILIVGLKDEQLFRIFELLGSNEKKSAKIYETWINSIDEAFVDPGIRNYSSINLRDSNQRDKLLFPLLRSNMYVIDFWLSNEVYPLEAKTFDKKLMCSAWDLCSENITHRVTGFSGTNDTKNVLPLPIEQNDLPELERTNEKVREKLLLPENQNYEKLPAKFSCEMILERLVQKDIPVLLDAGALMLELSEEHSSDEQIARKWLRFASPKYEAAIYFDTNDVLQTIDRKDIIAALDCSVYNDNLEHCLIYLDEVHTRGTDLKFPPEWKACVTLSGDITRDKTVQACMRMRQLGKGHSIAFWASHEADMRIRKLKNLQPEELITNEHIVDFICENSKRCESDNTIHWAASAYNYTKKLIAHRKYENNTDTASVVELSKDCIDYENTTLEKMYGDKEEIPLTEIMASLFGKMISQSILQMSHEQIESAIQSIGLISKMVIDKLKDQAPNAKRFRQSLDEHYEKELEMEKEHEEERYVENPPNGKIPATPLFDDLLLQLFSNCPSNEIIDELKSNGKLCSLISCLYSTKLVKPYIEENPWPDDIFVTRDFIHVVQPEGPLDIPYLRDFTDDFLRPIWWIAQTTLPNNKHIWILLSSFECERLIPTFRKSIKSVLFMYRPRLNKTQKNLLHETRLQITAKPTPLRFDTCKEAQIGAFSGTMYFGSEIEQNAYCNFLGLIPRPRDHVLESEFNRGMIAPNGFVPSGNRKLSDSISQCVGACRFERNPVDLVLKLIKSHHQSYDKDSHVVSILEHGVKMQISCEKN